MACGRASVTDLVLTTEPMVLWAHGMAKAGWHPAPCLQAL